MKVYISADIEGIAGINSWSETYKNTQDYTIFQEQMSQEVAAACQGALEAGATDIIVKDAHETGRNIIHNYLPREVKLIRGFSNHPYGMVEGLDNTYDAVIMLGYHCGASSNGSLLSHTLDPNKIYNIKINGIDANEFLVYAYVCYSLNVPVTSVIGDEALVKMVRDFNESIYTLAVQKGFGGATISIHPELAKERVRTIVYNSLVNKDNVTIEFPDKFELEVTYNSHLDAYKASFFPGVIQDSEKTVKLKTKSYDELMCALMFII